MLHREMLINGFFVGGECDQAVGKQVVRSPYDGAIVGTAAEGDLRDLTTCLESAAEAYETWRHSPRRERQALLRKVAQLVRETARKRLKQLQTAPRQQSDQNENAP